MDLYTKSRFGAILGLTNFFSKGRGIKTVGVSVTNLVSKVAQKKKKVLKEKSVNVGDCRKRRGGIPRPPPHPLTGLN